MHAGKQPQNILGHIEIHMEAKRHPRIYQNGWTKLSQKDRVFTPCSMPSRMFLAKNAHIILHVQRQCDLKLIPASKPAKEVRRAEPRQHQVKYSQSWNYMILQDRSGMEGGEQKRLVHLGEDLNHKLVMAGLGSAENECKKPWRQWAKMKKQTWPDPWNNQISQAVPMDYGHWNSSKQKKQFANTSCLIENVSTEQRSAFIKIKWAARLLIPTVSYKAWNQNSVSQQNSLGTRTKIVKQQTFKTCHALICKGVLNQKRRMKQSNDSTCKPAATIEKKRGMPCMPLFTRKKLFMHHGACMATSK